MGHTAPPITTQSNGCVTLYSLSGLVIPDPPLSSSRKDSQKLTPLEIAKEVLNHQKQLKRDERRVLVASSVCYSRAIGAFTTFDTAHASLRHGLIILILSLTSST